jgi:hypothetical protein
MLNSTIATEGCILGSVPPRLENRRVMLWHKDIASRTMEHAELKLNKDRFFATLQAEQHAAGMSKRTIVLPPPPNVTATTMPNIHILECTIRGSLPEPIHADSKSKILFQTNEFDQRWKFRNGTFTTSFARSQLCVSYRPCEYRNLISHRLSMVNNSRLLRVFFSMCLLMLSLSQENIFVSPRSSVSTNCTGELGTMQKSSLT